MNTKTETGINTPNIKQLNEKNNNSINIQKF